MRQHWLVPTLGDRLSVSHCCSPSAAFDSSRTYGVTMRDFVVALSLSARAAPPAQLYTSTAEAGGISFTGPPIEEIGLDGRGREMTREHVVRNT